MKVYLLLTLLFLLSHANGYIMGLAARDRGRARPGELWAAWRFRRRFPIGCKVRIKGNCCEPKHVGEVHVVRRHVFGDRWEIYFDLATNTPYSCCANGVERVE